MAALKAPLVLSLFVVSCVFSERFFFYRRRKKKNSSLFTFYLTHARALVVTRASLSIYIYLLISSNEFIRACFFSFFFSLDDQQISFFVVREAEEKKL